MLHGKYEQIITEVLTNDERVESIYAYPRTLHHRIVVRGKIHVKY